MRKCEKCSNPAVSMKDRFCKSCKKQVLRGLSDAGYLQDTSEASPIREQKDRSQRSSKTLGGEPN